MWRNPNPCTLQWRQKLEANLAISRKVENEQKYNLVILFLCTKLFSIVWINRDLVIILLSIIRGMNKIKNYTRSSLLDWLGAIYSNVFRSCKCNIDFLKRWWWGISCWNNTWHITFGCIDVPIYTWRKYALNTWSLFLRSGKRPGRSRQQEQRSFSLYIIFIMNVLCFSKIEYSKNSSDMKKQLDMGIFYWEERSKVSVQIEGVDMK